jgi:DNA-binding response OmpR family regulator
VSQARKILIADPDPRTLRQLAPVLRARGFQVYATRDGSKALEVSILRTPDVVLFDDRSPLLDGRTFMRILRSNPRTEQIPVLFLGEAADADGGRVGTFLRKPIQEAEVMARIDQILRKAEAARAVSGDQGEIQGNLAQIPLPDLLQILAMNRKSGHLSVERDGERSELTLREGRLVDAVSGHAVGEKAAFRLMARREGQFAFVPGTGRTLVRIERKLDELVLEGMRQADEAAQLLPSLPAPGDILELAVAPSEVPPSLHPVTAEVVRLLDRPRPLSEVVDHCGATDLESMRALGALIEHKLVRRREGPPVPGPEIAAVLGPSELHALRGRVAQGRASGSAAVGKVLVAGGGPLARRAALGRIATLPGYQPDRQAEVGMGTFGRLVLGDGLRVDLCDMPSERSQRPLWRPFASGALGLLLLLPAEGCDPLLGELARRLGLPVVLCGAGGDDAIPVPLRDLRGSVSMGGADAAEALRCLLVGAAARRPVL